jgi:hypothetical protein
MVADNLLKKVVSVSKASAARGMLYFNPYDPEVVLGPIRRKESKNEKPPLARDAQPGSAGMVPRA